MKQLTFEEAKNVVYNLSQFGVTVHDLINYFHKHDDLKETPLKFVYQAMDQLIEEGSLVKVKYKAAIESSFLVPKGTEFIFNNVRAYSE